MQKYTLQINMLCHILINLNMMITGILKHDF